MSLGQVRDVNNREVFKNHEFCAEFLRDYTDLALLKNITADDIEDVTEKYHAATVHKQNTGDSRNLSFRYPPILPIVYYEGVSKWTDSNRKRTAHPTVRSFSSPIKCCKSRSHARSCHSSGYHHPLFQLQPALHSAPSGAVLCKTFYHRAAL